MTQERLPATDEGDGVTNRWRDLLSEESARQAISQFVVRYRPGIATGLSELDTTDFSAVFKIKFRDGGSAVIRFENPGVSSFPEEKIKHEAATLRFIQDNTPIPVPYVHHWGTRENSPLGIGPFIIMEYMDHKMTAAEALNASNIDHAILETVYRELAKIMLQLSKLEFACIGALEETQPWSWQVRQRPLPPLMNELVRSSTLQETILPAKTFSRSSEYLESLAAMHIEHFVAQPDNTAHIGTDYQRQYVARHLFLKLAREKRLLPSEHDNGPFRLLCDKMRPSSVLLNANYHVVGVVGWGLSYAAPRQFAFSPPRWLLLEQPRDWKKVFDDWRRAYDERLGAFLDAMVMVEDEAVTSGNLKPEQRLSGEMREGWENGDFWVAYAACNSFAFDAVYWSQIDQRFFGRHDDGGDPECTWKRRLALLDEQTQAAMDTFVTRKMDQARQEGGYRVRTSAPVACPTEDSET
ncbi:hypothetical protein NLG97_g8590 [Lecanicillium saksenae]|uniref:Uncharacterized protein n=1 Tax=Lecanicillium saksenae TaxID=468837 RepID=A0ACC1QIG1_9HYPO|nr:hypothetical protein NLG97_g8590 [Lecanicillium saksenae]